MHKDQEHQHGTCAAELPGICDVNLVSHTMGDGTWPSAWSRGICKRENPTQGAPARAQCPTPAAKSDPSGVHSEQNAQVSQWRTRPIAWTSRRRNRFLNSCLRLLTPASFPPHARTFAEPQSYFRASIEEIDLTRPVYSILFNTNIIRQTLYFLHEQRSLS